jgi:hypothetical protein
VNFQIRRLGNDVFNEVTWFDPSGHLIRLIEARTFSPIKRGVSETSQCGYFLEIALPTADREGSKTYWEQFGFVGIEELDDRLPHISCTSDFIDLGLYEPTHLRRCTLRFEVDDVGGTLARLSRLDLSSSGEIPPPLRQLPAAVLITPEGAHILLTQTGTTFAG